MAGQEGKKGQEREGEGRKGKLFGYPYPSNHMPCSFPLSHKLPNHYGCFYQMIWLLYIS
jgi:hypothetical protein